MVAAAAAFVVSFACLLRPAEIEAFSSTRWFVFGQQDRKSARRSWSDAATTIALAPRPMRASATTRAACEKFSSPTSRRRMPSRLVLHSIPRGVEHAVNKPDNDEGDDSGIDLALDPRLYKVRLPRVMGIDWKTDLSFRWVSVRGLDPTGAASRSGAIQVGDQLCELTPVARKPTPISLLGAPFDEVMQAFAELDRTVAEVDLVFFRGTKDELMAACTGVDKEPDTITVTVVQNKGSKDESVRALTAPAGVNLRELLVENGINVYQSVTRWTNCKGKQLCGTCIVNVVDGAMNTNRKSMDEASTLRENPDSYRLSCVAFAYGDVTVETFPPINAAQWTR